jgi:hypothetical protein
MRAKVGKVGSVQESIGGASVNYLVLWQHSCFDIKCSSMGKISLKRRELIIDAFCNSFVKSNVISQWKMLSGRAPGHPKEKAVNTPLVRV